MHVIEAKRYAPRPHKPRRWPLIVIPAVLLIIAGTWNYLRPLPAATVSFHAAIPAPTNPALAWPSAGQAAVAAGPYGLIDTSGSQEPIATASTAKVILALCVLQEHPLKPGQAGPTYTIDATDMDIYNQYVAEDGSLLPVALGEQLSEYQALQALMIPSANNIADALTRWVFGGQSAYATYASEFLQEHGIDNTHIGSDASGFDPSTTSTASDMAQLGLLALKNPVLMTIAGQSTATFPLAGTVSNYDTILGQSGITGLKTGNNDADTGAFVFTATTRIGDTAIPVTGAVMGAPTLNAALQESVQLAGSLEHSFEQVHVADAGQPLGTMRTAWGASADIVASKDVRLVRWKATPITEKHQLDTSQRSSIIGALKLTAGPNNTSAPLRLSRPLAGPSFWWRLTRH